MPDWRDEIATALDFWIHVEGGSSRTATWSLVGTARPTGESGWFAVDTRGRRDLEQAESLRLGRRSDKPETDSYPVLESVQDGPVLRIRVPQFVRIDEPFLWQRRQPPALLLGALKDALTSATDPRLAHDLARGRLAGPPSALPPVAGYTSGQQRAYESCLCPGLRLVWGPPGTGKTRVLADSIAQLCAAGRRVLLVSATNIAVDNALMGVVRQRRHAPGQLVRVGTPHHPDVVKQPEICLPALVRQKLSSVEQRRERIQDRLTALTDALDELQRLKAHLSDYDPDKVAAAREALAREQRIPLLAQDLAAARRRAQSADNQLTRCHRDLQEQTAHLRLLGPARDTYARVDAARAELAALADQVDQMHARILITRGELARAQDSVAEQRAGLAARLRGRRRAAAKRAEAAARQRQLDALVAEHEQASELLGRRRTATEQHVERLLAAVSATRVELDAAREAVVAAERADARAATAAAEAEQRLHGAQQALLAAESMPPPTDAQRALVRRVDDHGLDRLYEKATALARETAGQAGERERLEKEYRQASEEFDRLRKGAEQEIIGGARLVATTLARLQTNKAVTRAPYDVVLVDEVSAAALPYVLHAASLAKSTVVLLGDFLQLGAVLPPAVQKTGRPDVRRWVATDVFTHCGIRSAAEARALDGCAVLDVQHRFGRDLTHLANQVAYDGVLRAADEILPRPSDDPEIVVLDTDGLGDLAIVRPVSRSAGWWPAGALLSRILAEYHQDRGETTGIVTPYSQQAEATLEAVRDSASDTAALTEVGTAHRFQGREFPIVVFDLVEEAAGDRWIKQARRVGNPWQRDGVRLFTVAVTRAKTRVYIVGSGSSIRAAAPGTPLHQLALMLKDHRARLVPATMLLTPGIAAPADAGLGVFGSELAEVLARHVTVVDIDDERSFFQTLSEHIAAAQRSLWIWSPWAARRVNLLLPELQAAAERGVTITIFVRDPTDQVMRRPDSQQVVQRLREIPATVVEVNVMHQKIVVVDEKTVLLGSLNTLSQSRTREVMLAMRGAHFARRLLKHEHAEAFATPPRCGACHGTTVSLRYTKTDGWQWRCYSRTCPDRGRPRNRAWSAPALR